MARPSASPTWRPSSSGSATSSRSARSCWSAPIATPTTASPTTSAAAPGSPPRRRAGCSSAARAGAVVAPLGLGLLAAALITLVSASSAAPPVDPAHLPLIGEGPTNRVALNGAWTVARDAADQGEAQGWPAGHFPGQQVHVPYVVNPTPITGPGGLTNYPGSPACFHTSFSLPRAGVYALR